MSKVLVWKCDHTGKLFEDEKKYKSHLSKLARERREQRKIQIKKEEVEAKWLELTSRLFSSKDLAKIITENQQLFWNDAATNSTFGCSDWSIVGRTRKGVVMTAPQVKDLVFENLVWRDSVSNTHSCPRGGVTNFSWVEDKQRGYPGWKGRVSWKASCPKEWTGCYLGSDLFRGRNCNIHTGTGGGGGWRDGYHGFAYDVEIFAADWPGMYEFEMRRQALEEINRQRNVVWQTLGAKAGTAKLLDKLPDNWVLPDVWNFNRRDLVNGE